MKFRWGWVGTIDVTVAYLSEELLQQKGGPAMVQAPVFGRMADVRSVQQQGQRLGLVWPSSTKKASSKLKLLACGTPLQPQIKWVMQKTENGILCLSHWSGKW